MDYIITTNLLAGKTREEEKAKELASELRAPIVWNHLVEENKYVEFEEKSKEKAERKLKKRGIENPDKLLEP
jgi:hypothetical protein